MMIEEIVGSENPFPGPKAYGRDDRAYFFGREDEIQELVSLILSSSATLLFAPSGTGKSSLLQAGVGPLLEDQFDFVVLPAVHLGAAARPGQATLAGNRFIQTVCETVVGDRPNEKIVLDIAAAAELNRGGSSRRVLLLLDQFEEVFQDPGLWRERDEFFAALTEAVDAHPWLRVVVALRSDYLADLVPHEDNLPGNLFVRYQLDSLTEPQVSRAVSKVFNESRVELPNKDLSGLLDALFADSHHDRGRDTRVNAVQLQILCRKLWAVQHDRKLRGEPVKPIWNRRLSLQGSMAEYVDEAVALAVQHTHTDETALRWWLGTELVTKTGLRSFAQVEEATTKGLANDVVRALADARLVQLENRHGTRLAELTHDSMVDAVRDSNERWRQVRRRQRRRFSVVVAILAIALAVAGPFLIIQRGDFVAAESGNLDPLAEKRIEFSAEADGTLVSLTASADVTAVPVHAQVLAVGKNEKLGAATTITGDSGVGLVAVRTTNHQKYVVVLKADDPVEISYTLTAENLKITDAKNGRITTDGPRLGLRMTGGSEKLVRVVDAVLDTVDGEGIDVVSRTSDSVVIKSGSDGGTAVVTAQPVASGDQEELPFSVEVSDPSRSSVPKIGSPTSVEVERIAFLDFSAGKTGSPFAVEGTCDDDVRISLIGDGVLPDFEAEPALLGKDVLPLNVGPGLHRLVLVNSGGNKETAKCQVLLRRYGVGKLSVFGRADLQLPAGQFATAYSLALPAEAVIVADESDDYRLTTVCLGERTADNGDGEHFVFLVEKRSGCALWLTRLGSDRSPALSVPVSVASVGGR